MPIRKIANAWQVDIRKKGVVFRKSCSSRNDAVKLEKHCMKCIEDGLPLPEANCVLGMTSEILFRKTADKYWSDSDWGLTQIRRQDKILDVMGRHVPIADISATLIDDVIQHFKKNGASASSLNKISACISKSLNLAVDRGWLDRKPKLDWIPTKNGRLRYLIQEEEAYLVQRLTEKNETDCRDFFLFLLDTGLRRGEGLRLSCRDVDLDKGTLSVWETKNGHPRTVPLTRRVKNILQTRIDTEGRLKNKPIFNLTEDKIRRVWEWLRDDMGLQDDKEFVLHSLRHTCASRLVQRGIQLQVVQQWLGHKSIHMTLRYAHLDTQNLLDASRVLESDDKFMDNMTG